MTLDPVFRSKEAVDQIMEDGFLLNMADSYDAHQQAIRHIYGAALGEDQSRLGQTNCYPGKRSSPA